VTGENDLETKSWNGLLFCLEYGIKNLIKKVHCMVFRTNLNEKTNNLGSRRFSNEGVISTGPLENSCC